VMWISNPTPVPEPGMWHLRKEADGYAEFVHRRTGEVLIFGSTEKDGGRTCTSKPECPCDSCVRVRAEIAEGRSGKDEQNKIAEDFLRSYSQTNPVEETSSRMNGDPVIRLSALRNETICLG
jgi:hypothetical protein